MITAISLAALILTLLYIVIGVASPRLLGNEKGFRDLWYVPELVTLLRHGRPQPEVQDLQLPARYDHDTLQWALPFTEEDRQFAIAKWIEAVSGYRDQGSYTLDEFFVQCPHTLVDAEVRERPGFGKIVAARCKYCRSTVLALMDDWLDARYKLSATDHTCRVVVVDKSICGCGVCEYARRPPSQRMDTTSYGS